MECVTTTELSKMTLRRLILAIKRWYLLMRRQCKRKMYLGREKSRVKFWACTFFKFSLKHTSVDVNRTVGYTSLEVKRKSAGKKNVHVQQKECSRREMIGRREVIGV